MNICYIIPGVMDRKEAKRRESLLRSWASPGTNVDIRTAPGGPASIESAYEEYLSIPLTAKVVMEAEADGYDAAILGCAGDPGLDAMRELTKKMLVVGSGTTSYLAAAMLGRRFAVLTVDDNTIHSCHELAYKAGCKEKLEGVVALNIPVLELGKDRQASLKRITAICQPLIGAGKADSLVLGCMTMGFLEFEEALSSLLSVPVINPSKIVLTMTEALVKARLMHSKIAYATPPKLRDGRAKTPDDLYIRPFCAETIS